MFRRLSLFAILALGFATLLSSSAVAHDASPNDPRWIEAVQNAKRICTWYAKKGHARASDYLPCRELSYDHANLQRQGFRWIYGEWNINGGQRIEAKCCEASDCSLEAVPPPEVQSPALDRAQPDVDTCYAPLISIAQSACNDGHSDHNACIVLETHLREKRNFGLKWIYEQWIWNHGRKLEIPYLRERWSSD